MMKCSQYQEKLWEYYDGTLAAQEAAEVKEHLESCADCAAEAKLVKQMMENLHTLPEADLPKGYHAELMEKIAREDLVKFSDASINQVGKPEKGTVVPFQRKQRKSWKNLGLVAAAVVLVAAAGGIQGIQNMRAPQEAIIQEARNNTPEKLDDTTEQIIVPDNDQAEPKAQIPQDAAGNETIDVVPAKPQQTAAQPKTTQTTPSTTETTQSSDVPTQTAEIPAQSMTEEKELQSVQADTLDTQPLQGAYAMIGAAEETAEQPEQPVVIRANDIQTPEQISLTVTDAADAMTSIREVITEMELTEKEATDSSITVTMKESQKKLFVDELAKIGTLPDLQVSESTAETMIDVKVVCVEAEK